ncbi:ABC transporter permease [Qingshengfaniella alkalisoli]|uniref:ABC transporter permease n=1 Tax=Qingshengfaniella alkalisoli TaxID=2599296 RepID=A0A5B8J7J3_9RHOB|nr:ABC transporter permease [Qingshengfaniella alkalisoli]QDY70447.1 ABC transporter permease [Qingshengfaniella alkalisoli]
MSPVLRLLLRRLGISLIVLVGVSMLIFGIARVIPGDPARIALGPNATAEQIEKLRTDLHLDEPIYVQYGQFLKDLARGDLGVSLYTNRPVTTDIAEFLPATLELVIVAGIMMVGIGLPLGIWSARFRGKAADHLIRLLSLLGVSAPSFVWAVILMLLFAYFLPIFPIAGRISDVYEIQRHTGFLLIDTLVAGNFKAFGDAAWHIILPAFALALSGIGQAARLTRANMIETYDKPYIEMAQAYGFKARRIANRYAFKPSLIPSLTVIGLDFAAMLGNAFLVEAVFAWPGLSRYGVNVILRKDLNAIIGTVLIISATFLIVNLIVDLLIAFLNPRIRYSQRGAS